jgi:hypothetical protein
MLTPPNGPRPAWYWRWLLITQRRILFIAQLAIAAILIAILGVFLFDWKIPGPDYTILIPDAS